MHGQNRVLALVEPPSEERDLLMAVEHLRSWWPGWERVLVGACVIFHGGIASALALAPEDQIVNAGTRPVFEIADRYVWAGLFALAGVCAAFLLHRQTALRQFLTWFVVLPLGGSWWTAFVLAVVNGRGSAIGVVVWLVLYGLWVVAAFRIALGKR